MRGARLVGREGVWDVRISRGVIRDIDAHIRAEHGEETLDLAGRWLIPGLWDAHVHLMQWAQVARRFDVSPAASAAEAAELVRRYVAEHPERDGVLVGFGYRAATWPDQPSTEMLDEAAPGRAVVLVSGDLHSGWFSTPALHAFERQPDPSGLVREEDFLTVASALDGGTDTQRDAWVHEAAAEAAALGVVGVVDFESDDPRRWTTRMTAAAAADRPEGWAPYPLRVRAAVWPDQLQDVLGAGLRGRSALGDAVDGRGHPMARLATLKVLSDGALNTRTAYCHDPYPGGGFGGLNYQLAELVELMNRALDADLSCSIHAIGDAAAEQALRAFEATGATGSIEHAQLLTWEDIPRMAASGITASVQPAHLLDDRDVADVLWPGRGDRAFPLASLVAAGVPLIFGSDAPVSPLDPWLQISAAVTRTGDERAAWGPEQRLGGEVALAAATGRGVRPRVGGRADLAILDVDPLAAPPGTRVAGTLIAGEWTHRAMD